MLNGIHRRKNRHWLFPDLFFIILFLTILFILSCDWFSPPVEPVKVVAGSYEEPTTLEKLFNNLRQSLIDRDIDRYEEVFHPDFKYINRPSKIDSLDEWWGLSTELQIMLNMFENVDEIQYNRGENRFYLEYGVNIDHPNSAEVSEEHPDEIWLVFDNYVEIEISGINYKNLPESYFVQQDMIYKVVKESITGYYFIIRWIDVAP